MDIEQLVLEHGVSRDEAAEVLRRMKAAPMAP